MADISINRIFDTDCFVVRGKRSQRTVRGSSKTEQNFPVIQAARIVSFDFEV